MTAEAGVVRIAHAYGNRIQRIEDAIASGADLIETDLRYDHGEIVVRHERRLWPLPLLYDFGLRGIHRDGPWAINVASLTLRVEPRRLRLRDVLQRVSGRGGLMLDLKAAPYDDHVAAAFVDTVLSALRDGPFEGDVDFCGSWRFIDLVRDRRPEQRVHYSIDGEQDWRALERRFGGDQPIRAITIHPVLLTPDRARMLRDADIEYYVWDISDRACADSAIARGAAGLIADDLVMLHEIAGTKVRGEIS